MDTESLRDISWKFLYALYCEEINRYITSDISSRIRGSKYLSQVRSADDIIDTIARLCHKPKEYFHYHNLLEYLLGVSMSEPEKANDNGYITKLEVNFIGYFQNAILNNRRSSNVRTTLFNVEPLMDTYCLWLSTGIVWKDWFILSEWVIANKKKETLEDFRKALVTAFSSWSGVDSWLYSYKTEKHRKVILHVLCLFLIMLRYEYVLSENIVQYLDIMYSGRYPEGASLGGRYLTAEVLKANPIVEEGDKKLLDELEFFKRPSNMPGCEFLPFIKRKLTSVESLNYCMERFSDSYDKVKVGSHANYRDIEILLKPEKTRLLVDYEFPYTTVRWKDTFLPVRNVSQEDAASINLVNRLYIKILLNHLLQRKIEEDKIAIENKSYNESQEIDEKKQSREEEYENLRRHTSKGFREKVPECGEYDYIQVLPNPDNEQSIVHKYNSYLKKSGQFFPVISQEEILARREVQRVFEQFSHGLKFKDTIPSSAEKIYNDLTLDRELREIAFSIKFLSEVINSQISSYANPKLEEKREVFALPEVIDGYIRSARILYQDVVISKNESPLEDSRFNLYMNKALVTVLVHTLMDNAYVHGFKDSNMKNKRIHFILERVHINNPEINQEDDYLKMAICNNGKPFDPDFTLAKYKSNHAFSGPTGHTGIGGYQVNRIAVTNGGFINISKTDEWNVIIEIYFKPYEQ